MLVLHSPKADDVQVGQRHHYNRVVVFHERYALLSVIYREKGGLASQALPRYSVRLYSALEQRFYVVGIDSFSIIHWKFLLGDAIDIFEHNRTVICITTSVEEALLDIHLNVSKRKVLVGHTVKAILVKYMNLVSRNANVAIPLLQKIFVCDIESL